MRRYDVIIVGLGAMGSAAAFHVARRGARVLGLDRFSPPHAFGSSHGRSRIIREAYFENPLYVPLVQRAYHNWEELERLSGCDVLTRTGGLMLGRPDSGVVTGALASAEQHGLPYEMLTATDVHRCFPGFHVAADMVGILEENAGYVVPETAIAAHLAVAGRYGAELHTDEPVVTWKATDDGVEVITSHGTYRATRLLLAAGAWMGMFLRELNLPLIVERTVQYWFRPKKLTHLFTPPHFPVFVCEYLPGMAWYGIPDTGDGVKVALHHDGEPSDPDALRRTVAPEEVAYVRDLVHTFIPEAEGTLCNTAVCMYTNTPDGNFLIDHYPGFPQVIIASPCSGHGFKFASAIGEQLADLALEGQPSLDISPFRLSRPGLMGTRAHQPRT
jgi:sarcosine oxidase